MMSAALALLALSSMPNARPVTFEYIPPGKPEWVAVVGQFNGWDKTRHRLTPTADGKTWSVTVEIEPGVYEFLYCIDGKSWVPDRNRRTRKDPNGNTNNLLVVEPTSYDGKPGARRDGILTAEALQHRGFPEDLRRYEGDIFQIDLRTRLRDAHKVTFKWIDRSNRLRSAPARVVRQDELYEVWRAQTEVPFDGFRYWFEIAEGSLNARFPVEGTFTAEPRALPRPDLPDWIYGRVFYQIFPDRFADGEPASNPKEAPAWGSSPENRTFFGGDLVGVTQRLDHLSGLGVNGIYLNPIFAARSYHAYDTNDYQKVDSRFGGDAGFRGLMAAAKKRDMKVMLDGVFNHSGVDFFAFRDLREQGEKSMYKDWFFPKKFPIEVAEGQQTYVGWAGVIHMPKLNQDHPPAREYFQDIGRYWIREFGIDAWRLDVANEVSQDFWRAWRKAIREVDPQCYILGENWGDSSAWLQGDQHDATMNYPWRQAALAFFGEGSLTAAAFAKRLEQIANDNPAPTLHAMYNLLGSHDTPRLRTVLKGDRERERMIVAFQFAYPGIPSVYYGDELGMEGGHDPDCRRCMDWSGATWDRELLGFYQTLIRLRTQTPVLARGDVRTLVSDAKNGVYALERRYQKQVFRAYWNVGKSSFSLPVDTDFEVIAGERGSTLAPQRFTWRLLRR